MAEKGAFVKRACLYLAKSYIAHRIAVNLASLNVFISVLYLAWNDSLVDSDYLLIYLVNDPITQRSIPLDLSWSYRRSRGSVSFYDAFLH